MDIKDTSAQASLEVLWQQSAQNLQNQHCTEQLCQGLTCTVCISWPVWVLGTASSTCPVWLSLTVGKLGNFQMNSRKIVGSTTREIKTSKTLLPFRAVSENFSLYFLNICLVLLLFYCSNNLNLSLSDFKKHLECNYMPHDTLAARREFIWDFQLVLMGYCKGRCYKEKWTNKQNTLTKQKKYSKFSC